MITPHMIRRPANPLLSRRRGGYVFLLSVLFVGFVATATVFSLLLLGWAGSRSSFQVSQSAQAFDYAQMCTEQALLSLLNDYTYTGSGNVTVGSGYCTIKQIVGTGKTNRTLCVEGHNGSSVRRLQLVMSRVYPTVLISSWKEVSDFTLCP
jgi:hypothetical protein